VDSDIRTTKSGRKTQDPPIYSVPSEALASLRKTKKKTKHPVKVEPREPATPKTPTMTTTISGTPIYTIADDHMEQIHVEVRHLAEKVEKMRKTIKDLMLEQVKLGEAKREVKMMERIMAAKDETIVALKAQLQGSQGPLSSFNLPPPFDFGKKL
jgi:predicted RNase H-like nuclease (RuvC/YqgF family)